MYVYIYIYIYTHIHTRICVLATRALDSSVYGSYAKQHFGDQGCGISFPKQYMFLLLHCARRKPWREVKASEPTWV